MTRPAPTRILGYGILVFALFSLAYAASPRKMAPESADPGTTRGGIRLTLFRGSSYCPTCEKMEALTRRLLAGPLSEDVRSGRLTFRVVNVETPGNERYISSYDLTTTTLVLSARSAQGERFSRLDRGWELAEEAPEKFPRYVEERIRSFLEGLP